MAVIIVGGDAAGMSAASKIRRERPEQKIVAFERGPHTSYSACGIPYYLAGVVEQIDDLVARSPETFRERYGIDVRVGHEVVALDVARQRVQVRRLDDRTLFWEGYDQLLLATGAAPIRPPVPGSDADGIHALSTLESCIRVARDLEQQPRRAVIVGGGYIGLEMAEALRMRGLDVSLVERESQVMGTLDPDMGALMSRALREAGVTLYLEEALTGFETEAGRVRAAVTSERTLPADLVILALGVRPATGLAKEAGVELGVKDAIRVDGRLRTSVDGVWAAGDCAESFHLVSRTPVHVALGTVANKQGLVAGTNLAGGHAVFPGVVGTAVSKICGIEVGRTGLLEAECRSLGLPFVTATIESRTKAGYYPGAAPITVKLLAEQAGGRLLGGQIVGSGGSAKRIDVLATALTAGMTVRQIVDLDLSYAPPFSPVWDPVQTAARQAMKRVVDVP